MSVQQTLDGDEAVCGRERPLTLGKCYECGEVVLRSARFEHDAYFPTARSDRVRHGTQSALPTWEVAVDAE
jgi:hypothetical protein